MARFGFRPTVLALLVGAIVLSACGATVAPANPAPSPIAKLVTATDLPVSPTPPATATAGLQATAAPTPSTATTRKAYIGLFKDNAVAVLDLSTDRVLSTIPI